MSTAYVAGDAQGHRLRARADHGPVVQEPLRVDQVPGRGLGARVDGQGADRDLPAGDRGRRLADRARRRSSTVPTSCCARSPCRMQARLADREVRQVGGAVQRRAGRLRRQRADGRARRTTKAIGETLPPGRPRADQRRARSSSCSASSTRARSRRTRCRPRPVALALRAKPMQKLFEGIPAESIQYLNHPVRYDARRACDLMARHGLRLPRFPEYAETMVELLPRARGRPRVRAGALAGGGVAARLAPDRGADSCSTRTSGARSCWSPTTATRARWA